MAAGRYGSEAEVVADALRQYRADRAALLGLLDPSIEQLDRGEGQPFDAAEGANLSAALNLRAHIESGARRGLGLFIMRKVMDEIRYCSRAGRRNELTLVKHVGLGG